MNAIIETNWTQPPPSGTNSGQTVAQMNVTRENTCTCSPPHTTDNCLQPTQVTENAHETSLCSFSYVCCKRDTARMCVCVPGLVLLRRRPCSSYRYLLPAGQQTRRMLLQRANGTDTRTDTVPLRRPCSTYYAVPTKQSNLEVIGFPSWPYRKLQ